MPLFRVRRTIREGVIPAGLTYGEMAVNITDRKLYVGDQTGNSIEILGGSGGAETTWSLVAPTTAEDIVGIPRGTLLDVGETSISILERILYPYEQVTFQSLTTGLASSYELGQTAGNSTFNVSWTRSGPTGNWVANSAYYSYFGSLVTGVAITGGSPTAASASASYPAFRYTAINGNTQTFQITGQQTAGNNPVSRSTSSRWWSKMYWGKSTNAALTDRTGLTGGSETFITTASSGSGTVTTTDTGGYFYLFVHNYYELDTITLEGFGVSMIAPVTALVTNQQGFETDYKVYRSFYELPGSLSIDITYSNA